MDILIEIILCKGIEWVDHFLTDPTTEHLVYIENNHRYTVIETETSYTFLKDDILILCTTSLRQIQQILSDI